MEDIARRLRDKHRAEDGFTLIELLVVVVIIGVLVAIAVPVYLNYRQGAADKSAQSDVRGAITAVEQYYTDNGNTYPATAANKTATFGLGNQTVTLSDKTTLSYVLQSGGSTYKICARNGGGSNNGTKTYVYDSATGGSVNSQAVTSMATCV
jgi:type IV pilus assembly protein PilA